MFCRLLGIVLVLGVSCGSGVFGAATIDECPEVLPHEPPRDRFDVRVDDITCVMSIGDDLLTALAAKTDDIHNAAVQEFKGVSFASGADAGATTLHNLFTRYRPQRGGSHGAHPVGLCPGGRLCHKHDAHAYTSPMQDRLNVALSGAVADSLPVQWRELRRQARRLGAGEAEWKLIVVHVGAVDACQVGCAREGATDLGAQFEQRIKTLLESVNEHMPRSIVSLTLLSDTSQLHRYVKKSKKRCDRDARRIATALCPCAMTADTQSRYALSATIADLNARLLHLAHLHNTDPTKPLVGVHVSTPLQDTIYAKHVPAKFVSPLDCVHWTVRGQQALAVSAWRGLFVEGGVRRVLYEDDADVYCPKPDDRILLYTAANGESVFEL